MATSEPSEISQNGNNSVNKAEESDKTGADVSVRELSDNGQCCNMQDDDSTCSMGDGSIPRTSTPNRRQRISRISNSSSGRGTGDNISNADSDDLNGMDVSQISNASGSSVYNVPILGYEVMEERTRFTVFKIRVEHQPTGRNWFVFRRYTDFVRLHKKLRVLFKEVMLSLPPKRWFGSNFDPIFLEERVIGLQTYITSILKHQEICRNKLVREFFCFDDPPDPHDSIEEMRALWEQLEEKAYSLRCQMKEKDIEIECLHARIAMLKSQLASLLQSLKVECKLTSYAHTQANKQSVSSLSSSECHSARSSQVSQLHDLNLAIAHMVEKSLVDMDDESNDIEVGLDATMLCSDIYPSCSSQLDKLASDARPSEILEERWTDVQELPCTKNMENHISVKSSNIGATKKKHCMNKSIINHTANIKKQHNKQAVRTFQNGAIAASH